MLLQCAALAEVIAVPVNGEIDIEGDIPTLSQSLQESPMRKGNRKVQCPPRLLNKGNSDTSAGKSTM